MIVPLNSAAQPNPPASPFRALFDSFIRDFRVQNPSRKTIEVYTESALQLEAFLLERGRPLDPARIGRGDVADFLNHLQDLGRSPASSSPRRRGREHVTPRRAPAGHPGLRGRITDLGRSFWAWSLRLWYDQRLSSSMTMV